MKDIFQKISDTYIVDKIKNSVTEYIKSDKSIKSDDTIIFFYPYKLESDDFILDIEGFYSFKPLVKKSTAHFSEDRKVAYENVEEILKDSISYQYQNLLFGYGSLNNGFYIDGAVNDTHKLKDYGLNICNAYFTTKREELYFTEEFFYKDYNEITREINDTSIEELFKKSDLNTFISELVHILNSSPKDKYELSTIIRAAFYEFVKDISNLGKRNIDFFLLCSDFLCLIGVLDLYAVTDDGTEYNYYDDYEIVKNFKRTEYFIYISFNKRFSTIFKDIKL